MGQPNIARADYADYEVAITLGEYRRIQQAGQDMAAPQPPEAVPGNDIAPQRVAQVIPIGKRACLGLDPDIFVLGRGQPAKQAKAVCKQCAVITPCLEDALADKNSKGVRGGKTEQERIAIRAERGF